MATCKDCYFRKVCNSYFNDDYELQKDDCHDFKDKSKIVELPCKVGDTVYCISYENVVKEAKVTHFDIDEHGLEIHICYLHGEHYMWTTYAFKKRVFLNRAEAEAALEKMKGETDAPLETK